MIPIPRITSVAISWTAKLTAKPAIPRPASIDVMSTPSRYSTIKNVVTTSANLVKLAISLLYVRPLWSPDIVLS